MDGDGVIDYEHLVNTNNLQFNYEGVPIAGREEYNIVIYESCYDPIDGHTDTTIYDLRPLN